MHRRLIETAEAVPAMPAVAGYLHAQSEAAPEGPPGGEDEREATIQQLKAKTLDAMLQRLVGSAPLSPNHAGLPPEVPAPPGGVDFRRGSLAGGGPARGGCDAGEVP